jgi:hypothetical protein
VGGSRYGGAHVFQLAITDVSHVPSYFLPFTQHCLNSAVIANTSWLNNSVITAKANYINYGL